MSREISQATMKELRGVLFRWAVVLCALGAFALWASWRMSTAARRLPAQAAATLEPARRGVNQIAHDAPRVWYRCTMPECGDQGSQDPESRCPVCGMKRESVGARGGAGGDHEIRLNERATRLAEVRTEPAAPRLLHKRIRAVGRVGYDETRYRMVSAWIDGRIDKLFADFTGMTVSEGDHLVEIYSPELLSAQEEFLQAKRAVASTRESQTAASMRGSEQVLHSARRKLELLGVTETQIQSIKRSGEPQTHLVVHAPIGGTIVEKRAMEGMYVKTGSALYTIADLTQLWLLVDLYEADLPWVQPFQEARVTTRSLPGEAFTGEIVFIDPRVDPQTRTVVVRIHVDNPAMRLKPDMWVTAQIVAGLGPGGRSAVRAPMGAFACPMHPWEAANQPDICSICEMDMVGVETLPQFGSPTEAVPVLSVPRDAVMQTGTRALVYVQTEPGSYQGTEVTVGPLAHGEDGREYYPVLDGLLGGELVVTRGNFAIDSQMQLAGKPSLFAARGWGSTSDDARGAPGHAQGAADQAGMGGAVQTHCPVMGGEIDRAVYADFRGVRVYFCCPPCIEDFRTHPKKYIANLPAAIQAKLNNATAGRVGND